jgi:competence protein ComEC
LQVAAGMPLSLRLAALTALGAAAGLLLPHTSWRLAMCLALAAAAAAWLAHRRAVRGAVVTLLAVAMAGASAGRTMLAVGDAAHPPLVQWFDQQTAAAEDETVLRETLVKLRGRLVRDAAPTGFGAQLQLDVSHVEADGVWQPMRGGLALSVSGAFTEAARDWCAGRTIQVPVTVRRPTQYRNVGLADQARSLALRGMPVVASTKSALLVEIHQRGAWWDEWAAARRGQVRDVMARRVAPHAATSAAIGTAILIGDRAQLTPALEQRLQEAGTYHVVAISGGNIALLAGAVVGILWTCGVRFAPAAAMTAVVLIAYAWVIGGGASVARATTMAATYLALRMIDQRTHPAHALATSAAGLLLVSPLESAGFWLTFGATGALMVAAARWRGSTGARGWSPVAAIAVASLAVELLVMPISAYVFERVTVAGLALNLLAVPSMGMVQGAASLCVLADAIGMSRASDAAGYSTHLAATALIEGSGLVTAMPWATWRVPPPSAVVLAAYYSAVVMWLVASQPPIDSLGASWCSGSGSRPHRSRGCRQIEAVLSGSRPSTSDRVTRFSSPLPTDRP